MGPGRGFYRSVTLIAGDTLGEAVHPRPTEFDPTRFLGRRAAALKRRLLPFGNGSHRCTGAFLGEMVAVEMVSHWLNRFDLRVVPAGRPVQVVARPCTQPKGLRVEVLARLPGEAAES